MWKFITKALTRKTYGDLLYIMKEENGNLIFAVKAENQKTFGGNLRELDKSWVLFLDYAKYKRGKTFVKPTTTQQYTNLRSRFLNALVRCNCSGSIKKVHKSELKELNLDKRNNYRYFKYIRNVDCNDLSRNPLINQTDDGASEATKELMNSEDFDRNDHWLNQTDDEMGCQNDERSVEIDAISNNVPSLCVDEEGLSGNMQPGDLLLCIYDKDGTIKVKRNLGKTKLSEAESLLLARKDTEPLRNNHMEDFECSFYHEHLTPPTSVEQFDEDSKLPFEELDFESESFSKILI